MCWFHLDGQRLLMQPHPLSRCVPEVWRLPEEAEVVGRVGWGSYSIERAVEHSFWRISSSARRFEQKKLLEIVRRPFGH